MIMAIRTITGITITAIRMTDRLALLHLLTWTSPSYPTGAFSYSLGLEWAVEEGDVTDEAGLERFVLAHLGHGAGWIDAVLFAAAWRAAGDAEALDDLADLAAAWRGGAEAMLESRQQGKAFLATARAASPHPALDDFAERRGKNPVTHSIALALACAAYGVPLSDALGAYLHGVAANLVSAGIRLGVTGQTGGQRVTTRIAPALIALADRAMTADIDRIGTAAIRLDLAAIAHETQRTRLFRS
jgi:urease accessory protein